MNEDYLRTGDPTFLNVSSDPYDAGDWLLVRVFRDGESWIWEDTQPSPTDGRCTADDLLVDSTTEIDLPELLCYMVMTRFVSSDVDGDPIAAFLVVPFGGALTDGHLYYIKPGNSSPYADLSPARVGDLDQDGIAAGTRVRRGYPEVLDSFGNPIILTVARRTVDRAELCSLGPDGRLDFDDENGNGLWDITGEVGEPANNGYDDDRDGLVDEKTDEVAHTPELVDDIITWE